MKESGPLGGVGELGEPPGSANEFVNSMGYYLFLFIVLVTEKTHIRVYYTMWNNENK